MTHYTFNSDPNELTSFDGGASPETSGTFLKHFLDFVRNTNSGNSSDNASGSASTDTVSSVGGTPAREPSPESVPIIPSIAQVRKVCAIQNLFVCLCYSGFVCLFYSIVWLGCIL